MRGYMVDGRNSWLPPEEALRRFQKPEHAILSPHTEYQNEESTRFGFVINNIGLLIAENTLSEVVKNAQMYPVPNTRSWMKGLINLRGNLVPVYDLTLLLGMTDTHDQYENLLVLGKQDSSVGILINNLPRVCPVSDWKLLTKIPVQIANLNDHVSQAFSSDEQIWLDFNEQSFFKSIKQQVAL